jgi:hypothetical protein
MFSSNRKNKVDRPTIFSRNESESESDNDSMGSSSSSSSSSDHEETQLSFQSTERKPAKKVRKIRVEDQGARKVNMNVPRRKPGRNPSLKRKMATTTTATANKPPRKPPVSATSKEFDDDDMNDSDMEVPYTQNLGIFDDSVLALELSDKKNEPLRPGDVILYNNPVFVAGSRESIRVTQVMSTDPDLGMPLSLANGEFLPADTYVRRIKEYKYGALIDHPGISRPIENFRFGKRALSKKDESGLSGFQKQVERLRDIVMNTREELKTFPQDMDTNTNKDKDNDKSSGDSLSSDSDASKTPPPKRNTVTRTFNLPGESSSDSEASDTLPLPKRKTPAKKIPFPKRKKFIPAGESSDSEASNAPLPKRKTPTKKTPAMDVTLWESSDASETQPRKRKPLGNNTLPPDSSDSDADMSSLPLNQLPVNALPQRNKKASTPVGLADKSNLGLDTDSDDSSIVQPLKKIQQHGNGATKGALSMQDFLSVSEGNNLQKPPVVSLGLSLSKRNGQERPEQDTNIPSPPGAASTHRATRAPIARSTSPPLPLQYHVKKVPPPTQRPTPAPIARSSSPLPVRNHVKKAPPPPRSSAPHARGVSFSKQNNRGNPIAEPTADWMSSPQRPHSSSSILRKYGRMSLSSAQKDSAPSPNKSSGWTCVDRRPPPSASTSQSKNRSEVTGSKPRADSMSSQDSLFDDPFATSKSVDLTASDSDGRSPSRPRAQKHRSDSTRKIRTTELKPAPSSSSRPKGHSQSSGTKPRIDLSSRDSTLRGLVAASIGNVDLNASSESDDQFRTSSRPQQKQKQKHRSSNARKEQTKGWQGMLSKKASATTSSKNKSSTKALLSKAASGRTAQRSSVFQPAQLENESCQDYACLDSSEDDNRHINHNRPGQTGSSPARISKEDRGYSSIESSSFRSSQSSQEVVGGKAATKKNTPKGQGSRRSLGSSSARTSTGSMQLSFQEVPRSGIRTD